MRNTKRKSEESEKEREKRESAIVIEPSSKIPHRQLMQPTHSVAQLALRIGVVFGRFKKPSKNSRPTYNLLWISLAVWPRFSVPLKCQITMNTEDIQKFTNCIWTSIAQNSHQNKWKKIRSAFCHTHSHSLTCRKKAQIIVNLRLFSIYCGEREKISENTWKGKLMTWKMARSLGKILLLQINRLQTRCSRCGRNVDNFFSSVD